MAAQSLRHYRNQIKAEAPKVDTRRGEFSHNIISCALRIIARDYGASEANRAIRDFKLELKGWNQEPEAEKGAP